MIRIFDGFVVDVWHGTESANSLEVALRLCCCCGQIRFATVRVSGCTAIVPYLLFSIHWCEQSGDELTQTTIFSDE